MIRYLLVDEEGQLHEKQADDYRTALADVGPEGWDMVRLDEATYQMRGFVNDSGLVNPETYRRNVVGSVMLFGLGANRQPYAGPIVLTGWHQYEEICSLQDWQVEGARLTNGSVRAALGISAAGWSPDSRYPRLYEKLAIERVRQAAREVVEAATPEIRMLTDDEAMDFLRGLR